MPMLRLLASSILASAFALTASAQAPVASLTATTLPPNIVFSSPVPVQPSTLPLSLSKPTSQPSNPDALHANLAKDGSAAKPQPDEVSIDPKVKTKLLAQISSGLAKSHRDVEVAKMHSPCYTLRVYGFTPQDIKSPHPSPSTETDCTPASSVHLKALQAPATVTVK